MSAPASTPTPGAVFLSYAHEDTDAARRIADALRGFGVEVWFDQSELRGGDAWDQKIRKQIKDCALFLPIISVNTQARGEGYFRLEWKLAVERTHLMAEGIPFLAPIAIDNAHEHNALVPPEFMRVHWTRLKNGQPTPQFLDQIKHLVEAPRGAAPGSRSRETLARADTPPVSQTLTSSAAKPPEARRHGPSVEWVAVVGALAAAVGIYWWWQSSPTPASGAGTRPPTAEKTVVAPAPKIPAKSLAVLAFANLSDDIANEYFSDGISEELLNVLAKVPGLTVSARTSAFHFKRKDAPIPEIAKQLGVAYVVEGSVRKSGTQVRITAQLIKATDGFPVWSDTFTRELKDIFAVQDEIAGLIAKNLSLKLGVSSAAATAAVNPEAFSFYVQARQAWNLRTAEGFAHAEQLLNRAAALDPNFARAHAALGDVAQAVASRSLALGRFEQRDSPVVARIRSHIDRALALDPDLAEAHASLGALLWQTWRVEESMREHRLAIKLNPSYATAHQWLGRALLSDGRLEEAEAVMRRATELDPLSAVILDNYHIPVALLGRHAEALAVAERALALQPESLQALVWKARSLSELGRHEEAATLLRRIPWPGTIYQTYAVRVFAQAGLKAEAEQAYAQLAAGNNAFYRYLALPWFGRMEETLATLEPGSIHTQPWSDVLFDAHYDPIRRDPRFVKLLATLGMTEAHARAQAWRKAHPPQKSK